MKCIKISVLLLGALIALPAHAATDNDLPLPLNYQAHRQVYNELGISFSEVASLLSHTAIARDIFSNSLGVYEPAFIAPPPRPVSLSEYETLLPHKTQRVISRLEKSILKAYLDNPNDVKLAKFLALYHLIGAGSQPIIRQGQVLERTIMADYFLNRAMDLGAREPWIKTALLRMDTRLERLASSRPGVIVEENRPAHASFIDTFVSHEENRYKAYDKLLEDYVNAPNNVFTVFFNNAVNLWVGGEAGYDDPTVLYNFVLGSYFSIRAITLAHQAELAWKIDSVNHKRFRLASIIGGFSVAHRRFLAKLHKDLPSIRKLDEEHDQWRREVNIVFHMFTMGYTLFEEPENFRRAKDLWDEGFGVSFMRPDFVTVQDRPRFTFNGIGMFIGTIDFNWKDGDFDSVRNFWMPTVPFLANYAYWDIGRDAYEHRVANAQEIFELYRNADPKDDPVPFNLKRRKWGYNTMTCQTCHQAQRKIWTDEEQSDIMLPPEDVFTVGTWPAFSTSWYGAAIRVSR